jgi:hypothetical protein
VIIETPEPDGQPSINTREQSVARTETSLIPPLEFKEKRLTITGFDDILDVPINTEESVLDVLMNEGLTATVISSQGESKGRGQTISSPLKTIHGERPHHTEKSDVHRHQSGLSPLDQPLRQKQERINETNTLILLDNIDNITSEITSTDSDKLRDSSSQDYKIPTDRLSETPVISRMGKAVLSSGSADSVRECTLQANTVHLRVDSMDLKNGSVVVEAIGRGNRSGTSEQL